VIKISSWICGGCLTAWIIFCGIVSVIENSLPPEEWGFLSIITAGIAIVSFALSYLGGHIIRGNKGALRLGVLISVLWVIINFVRLDPYNKSWNLDNFLWLGFIPVISYLGILWVISGFLSKKNQIS